MKKRKISALLICLILALNACTGSGPSSATVSSTGATSAETETAAQIPEQNKKPELVIMGEEAQDYSRAVQAKKTEQTNVRSGALYAAKDGPKALAKDFTVMVYIVGSNLESRYGAATNDMKEMIGADLDFTRNNLLVYTGGSKRWTSAISNICNSVINMENGEQLEVTAQTSETADMGAAGTLAEFINYCTAHYPAKHYGLVLWDHGAGPLWGYGSDELFGNDSLLLEELKGAMDQTQFNGDSKLDFVGFDACLMGSVESARLWKDYAQYMVGSEELESGRGWDYSFLNTLNGTDDARTIVSAIVEAYGKYYENNKSEFFNPDVTLAAMDLSKTDKDPSGHPFYSLLNAQPDSIVTWVKFKQQSVNNQYPYATISATITDGTYYQEPVDKTYTNIVGRAENNQIASNGAVWQRLSVPFDYESYTGNNVETKAIMVTMSTNNGAGTGKEGDELYVDDVELVYNADITSVKFDGNNVEATQVVTEEIPQEANIFTAEMEVSKDVTAEDFVVETNAKQPFVGVEVVNAEGIDFENPELQKEADQIAFITCYAADLSKASKWIVFIKKAGINYDLNGDGKVSTADIQVIINEMKKPSDSQDMSYDLNGDGKISTADIQVIINEMKK